MEKHIMTWSYWLGIVLAALAFLARGADVLGMGFLYFRGKGNSLGYHSYWDGAQLFLLVAIGTECYSWLRSQKSQA